MAGQPNLRRIMLESSGFFAMGGYAVYVWPAYAVALLVIGGLTIHSIASFRARQREAADSEEAGMRRARRRRGQAGETDDP